MSLYPTINCIGIDIASPPATTDHATVRYRKTGTSTWSTGHNAPKINTGHVVGSVFWLQPATSYDVEETCCNASGAVLSVATETAVTQMDLPWSPTVNTYYVDANAGAGGNGSSGSPFQTIAAGLAAAFGGDKVVVRPGTYRENLAFPRSGSAGHYIKLIGQSGAILDGTDTTIAAWLSSTSPVRWVTDGSHPNVYSVLLDGASGRPSVYSPGTLTSVATSDPIWRDNDYQYQFGSLSDLWSGTSQDAAHGGSTCFISEGWFFDQPSLTLTVRCLTAPQTHAWHIRGQVALYSAKDYIWIEGMALNFMPGAVYISGGNYNIVRYNSMKSAGILVDAATGPAVGNRIESNYGTAYPLTTYGGGGVPTYLAIKGTSMERSGVNIGDMSGVKGTIVRDNRLEYFFNGIYGSAGSENEVYRNVCRYIGDDGLEPDGAGQNYRAWGNAIDITGSGHSLAPINVGPAWLLFNRYTGFYAKGLKLDNSAAGGAFVYVYHNTIWSDDTTAAENGAPGNMQVGGSYGDNLTSRNNIIRVRGYGIRWTVPVPNVSMDRDSLYSGQATYKFYWNAVYSSRAALCTGVSQECNGYEGDPGLINPAGGLFGLAAGSPNIDTAVRIAGINDSYSGNGPDRGYVEFGQSEIAWTTTLGNLTGLVQPPGVTTKVSALPGSAYVYVNPDGTYDLLNLPAGSYELLFDAGPSYQTQTLNVQVVAGQTTAVATVTLVATSTAGAAHGMVMPSGVAVTVAARLAGVLQGSVAVAGDGTYSFASLPVGTYEFDFTPPADYQPVALPGIVVVSGGNTDAGTVSLASRHHRTTSRERKDDVALSHSGGSVQMTQTVGNKTLTRRLP